MDAIQRACDCDRNFIQLKRGKKPDAAKLTLLDACVLAGLIAFRYTLYVWGRQYQPIADMEFETEADAKKQVRYLKKQGFHGLIQPIVRKRSESGFMAYHATLGKSYTF